MFVVTMPVNEYIKDYKWTWVQFPSVPYFAFVAEWSKAPDS